MADIVERLRSTCKADKDCPHAPCFGYCLPLEAADEIERLRALCNDLHHDATCHKSFCRLCGEGIREWEARRG